MTMKLVFKGDNVINNQFLQKWSNRNNVSTIKNFITFSTIQHVTSCEWWIKVVGLCESRSLPLTTYRQIVAKVVKFFMVLAFFREYTISSSSRSILIQIVMAILLVIFVTSKKNKMVLKKRKNTHTHPCGWSWLVHWGFMAYLCIFCFFRL